MYIISNCKLEFKNKIELPSLTANSVDSDEMLQNAASHLGIHLLSTKPYTASSQKRLELIKFHYFRKSRLS